MEQLDILIKKFQDVSEHPEVQMKAYLSQGKKVVGCAPVYTPEEILHSMNIVPFGLWGADIEIEKAKSYFPAFICSITQSILELGMNGSYEGMSAILIPSLCDSLKCLGENWKYAVPHIPFIPMVYPQNRNSRGAKMYTHSNYSRVIEDLEKITGETFSQESLVKSMEIYNEHNRLMRELDEFLSDRPVLTAVERSAVYKSAYFMDKKIHSQWIQELLTLMKQSDRSPKNTMRIITTGIISDNKTFLSLLDQYGIAVVGDDMASESRQYRVDSERKDLPLLDLSEKFTRMGHCSVLFDEEKKRADLIVSMAIERKADAVLVVMTKFCDPEEFDYVIIKKACEKAGIRCHMIEQDRQMSTFEQTHTSLQTLVETNNLLTEV